MKIGKFSRENDLSVDTIRHYMELGLIIPEKIGGHYHFDDRCKKDLDDILSLKEMGFTLNEIKAIFLFKRLGKITLYQENQYYKEFFITKHKKIMEEIAALSNIKLKLEDKINEFPLKENKENNKIGVDIRLLNFFKCLKCNDDLMLQEGNILNNQIINGKLRCKCGNEYTIEDGILFVDKGKNDFFPSLDLSDYIKETAIEYLDNVYKGLEWAYKKLNFNELKNKVILELGTGSGFLLRHIYDDLPDDCIYIAVDHNMGRQKFLKGILERADSRKKVIFICGDFLQIPIKDQSVDAVFDYSGTSNYSFDHEEFLLKDIDHYVKEEAIILGAYILFKKFSMNSQIENRYRKNFNLNNIKEEIRKLKYHVIDERTSDVLEYGGKYENYFKREEKVYTYICYGKR